MEEVCGLSDKLSLRVVDIDKDAELAKAIPHRPDPMLSLVLADGGWKQDRITASGFPGFQPGMNFLLLFTASFRSPARRPGISQQTQAFLDSLQSPVHLEIFTTPT